MKVYRIKKIYPSIKDKFNVGDIIYLFKIKDSCGGDNIKTTFFPSEYEVYKPLFHQQSSPFICKNEVEENPEYFEKITEIYLEDPGFTKIKLL